MTVETVSLESSSPISAADPGAWNAAMQRGGGHLLQSWEWGEFKSRHGWEVERVCVAGSMGTAMAQVVFKRRGPACLAYVPRGPMLRPIGDARPLFRQLRERLDAVSRRRRALSLILEADAALGIDGSYRSVGFVRGPAHFQPSRTVKVPLVRDDQALLDQMHQKNRYSVKLAQRRGVTVERGGCDAASIDAFYRLLEETSERNKFGIHSRAYYDDFMRIFGDRAFMLFALVEGRIAAGVIAARFGEGAVYMYGGSSTTNRADGAAFLLQYETMRWARDAGCTRYDLWGIPAEDPLPPRGNERGASASVGEDTRGLYTFKVRFGGEIVEYPPMMERRYWPVVSWLARRLTLDRS